MSENRFEIRTNINGEHWLFDNKYDKVMMISRIRETLLDVCNRLNEQQDIICKLQDICGESDGANAKLRMENKRLKAENDELRRKLLICSAHLLSDECALTDGQIRKIMQEMEE